MMLAFAALAMGAGTAAGTERGTPAHADTVRWLTADEGNEVRYRVREQLARIDFPSDAVGTTSAVEGALVVTDDGTIVPGASRFVITVDSLSTDSDRRDNYIRRRTLDSATYPEVAFQPTALEGLTWPLTAGALTFRLRGDLTVRGQTRPVIWDVTATYMDGAMRGEARTQFTFEEFGMDKPSVGSVLSVADEIRLEYGFTLRRER
jgi:polyisoprenoid-binding protein YceI